MLRKLYMKNGIPVMNFLGWRMVSFRMYPKGINSMVEGWGKNIAIGLSLFVAIFLFSFSQTYILRRVFGREEKQELIKIIVCFGFSYFCGSLMFSYWLGRIRDKDIRMVRNGNPGAYNLFKVAGWFFGFIGGFLDFLKGFIPIFLLKKAKQLEA